MNADVTRRLEALGSTAHVVQILAAFLFFLGLGGAIATVVLGFTHDASPAVLAGLGGAFIIVLTCALLWLAATFALAWAATIRSASR